MSLSEYAKGDAYIHTCTRNGVIYVKSRKKTLMDAKIIPIPMENIRVTNNKGMMKSKLRENGIWKASIRMNSTMSETAKSTKVAKMVAIGMMIRGKKIFVISLISRNKLRLAF